MKSEEMRFEDAFDAIMRWYKDDVKYPLTPQLFDRLQRWKSAREFILTMKPLTDSFVVEFVMKTHGVSEPQAWRDVRDTKRFYASTEQVNKEFDRIMLIASIKDLRTKAEFAQDLKVVAQCNATLAKMGVGEEEQPNANVGKTIELHISFNPKLIGAKENPNLLAEVEKYIGEAAKRELMMEDEGI